MSVFTTLVISGLTCAAGAAAAWWNRTHVNAEERRRLAANMLSRVNERYKAYVELEDRMKRAIEVFDRTERRSSEQVSRLTARILELEDDLRSTPRVMAAAPEAADPLSCLDDPFAAPEPALPSLSTEAMKMQVADALHLFDDPFAELERDPAAELARLEGESKGMAEQWAADRAELSRTIDDLTRRVAELEPTSAELANRSGELETLRSKYEALEASHAREIDELVRRMAEFGPALAEREREIERLKQAHAELQTQRDEEVAGLETEVVRLQEQAAAEVADPDEVERWRQAHAQLQMEHDEQVTSLKAEMERLRANAESVETSELARERMQVVNLEARCHELEEENRGLRDVESYENEILRQSAELEGLRARVDQRNGEVEALSLHVRELEARMAEHSEVEKKCKSLERAVARARKERDGFKREVADMEDQMRLKKLSPTKLAKERKARHAVITACIDSLDPVAEAIEAESARVQAMETYYAEVEREKDAEIERLEECLSAMHPICDSAEALMAMHAASRVQALELEMRVNEAKAALAKQREAHADLLMLVEELAPFVDEVNEQDRELRNWEEAFETLVRDKNAEIEELEAHIGALEPVCDAVEALVHLLDEGIGSELGNLSA